MGKFYFAAATDASRPQVSALSVQESCGHRTRVWFARWSPAQQNFRNFTTELLL